jgi:TFIIF-interacting CTD phosphatase-like protein
VPPPLNQVARAIDPTRAYFGSRLISTPDDVPDLNQQQQKSLERLFPGGTELCLVMDDRDDVWEEGNSRHVLLVRPYR